MSELKTTCVKCGAQILQTTADSTDGLCMPCKKASRQSRDTKHSKGPVEISCSVDSEVRPDPVFFATAQDLLRELEECRHIGDSMHANKFELEAQKALLLHAIKYGVNFRLNDDHWGRTGYLLLRLFEDGKASMEIDGKRYRFAELKKEEWTGSTEPLGGYGGYLYRDPGGNIIYKRQTWIS